MPDILNTSVSGLLAFQRALATTSHNISNVNTEGYSRQRTNLSTRIPEPTGAGYIGTGVKADSVVRIYDQFLVDQLRSHTSAAKQLETFHNYASQVDNLLADPNAGLAPALQEFFNAMHAVADNPSSIPAREVFLTQAESLASRFNSIDGRLAALRDNINIAMENTVDEVNALARSIAKVNQNIVLATARGGGHPPNDLLDQRDLLIRKLAEHVPVSTVMQDDGAINVFMGKGQILVLGADAKQLVLDTTNPANARIRLDIAGGSGPDVTGLIDGGALGGLLSFRGEILWSAQDELNDIAAGLVAAINEQHGQGLDLNGNLGLALFDFAGNPPGSEARSIRTLISDPALLAAAAPLRAVESMANLGSAHLDKLDFDSSNAALAAVLAAGDVNITYDSSANGYVLSGALTGTLAYDPVTEGAGKIFDLGAVTGNTDYDGIRFQIAGVPLQGDSFVLGKNTDAVGDNGNALKLAALDGKPVMHGGTVTFQSAYGQMIAKAGSRTHQVGIDLEAQQALLRQAEENVESVSGVNLDEEAADMLKYQQAYQAAAQLIGVAQSLFDTLLNAVRR